MPLVARELAVLPRLAPLLPIPVPAPELVGEPSERFPRPFFGAPLLLGLELADAELSDGTRDELARRRSGFLRALHARDVRGRADPDRRPAARPERPRGHGRAGPEGARAARRARRPHGEESRAAERILREAERLPPSPAYALVHGDFHVRHVLVADGRVSGVIDWGDVCVGDPSIDLQLAWSLLPAERRAAFLDAYGPVDEETQLRARVLAVFFCALLADYARAQGLPAWSARPAAGSCARSA